LSEVAVTEEQIADAWIERMRAQARRELAKAGMDAAEIEEFMTTHYEEQLAAWKRERLLAVQREYAEIAEGDFRAEALRLWVPAETNSRMH
jgi:hypothetical protein